MNSSSNASTTVTPPTVLWAQRKDRIFLTVQLEGCKDPAVELKETGLDFKGKGGSEKREYGFAMEFNKQIDPESVKQNVSGREIFFTLMKKEDSMGFWPRLLKDSKKVHYLKTDFNRWKDEDDSDVDEQEDFNLDEMMQSMGGMPGGAQGMGEMGEHEDDSDDEDLPDLDQ